MSDDKSKYPDDREQTIWLTQTKNGSSLAFNHIVEKYQQPVYNLCYHMLQNADDAEDAAQEVFTRAYAKLNSYDKTSKFSTWLFSIASHYCIDQLRKHRFQFISWDGLASWYRFPGQESLQPERALMDAEVVQEIHTLLDLLPPDYRVLIILKYWHALSYEEIAEMRETTVSAIKSKLFRARKMMASSAMPESQANLRGAHHAFC